MQRFYFLAFASLISCGRTEEAKQSNYEITKKAVQPRSIDGVYEYVYPDNIPDLIENHYIVLKNGGGLYYGTSDEFDEARAGYLPGFFVVPMQDLSISGDGIRFKLEITSADLFAKAIPLKFKSSAEAKKAGYKQWEIGCPQQIKRYKGEVRGDTLYFRARIPEFDKRFIKVK